MTEKKELLSGMKIVYKTEPKMSVLSYFFGKFNKTSSELFILTKLLVHADLLW